MELTRFEYESNKNKVAIFDLKLTTYTKTRLKLSIDAIKTDMISITNNIRQNWSFQCDISF